MAYRWTLGLFAAFALGCFSDLEETSSPCPDGSSGCSCYGNGTCDDNLVCNPDNNCVSQDCQDGRAECPCYGNGTCDAGLTCTDNICQPAAGTDGGTGMSSATSTTNSSAGPTTNASMTSVGVTGFLESSGTFWATTFPGETGFPPPCDCPGEEACLPGGGCVPNPYVSCAGGDVCFMGECITRPEGETVCAPECQDAFDCPTLPGQVFLPECLGVCVVPCVMDEDCPPEASACEESPFGGTQCMVDPLAPR